MSIWTALWTSCVPMDVREDFKLATQRCLDEDPCFCIMQTACWPCRCKLKCGSCGAHHRHRPHRGASRVAAAAGGAHGAHRQSSAVGPGGSAAEGGTHTGARSSAAMSLSLGGVAADRTERGQSTAGEGGGASSSRRLV